MSVSSISCWVLADTEGFLIRQKKKKNLNYIPSLYPTINSAVPWNVNQTHFVIGFISWQYYTLCYQLYQMWLWLATSKPTTDHAHLSTDRETESSQNLAQGHSQKREARNPRIPPQVSSLNRAIWVASAVLSCPLPTNEAAAPSLPRPLLSPFPGGRGPWGKWWGFYNISW